ncbi:MAG: hypothetical protein HOW97_15955 [Catenulispora sp.]|nr:hypothetical protein [Catenulispora sp.]
MAGSDPGDNWDPKAHSAIPGPGIGTVKANSEAIKALADWLKQSLTDPNGVFVLAKAWLTDCAGTGYPGAPLRYDLYATRSSDPTSMAGPDTTSVGILVGYPPYLKSAADLKKTVDAQLGALYLKFVEDSSKSDMSSGNLYTMVSKIADQLKQVAADYDKGDEAIEKDLGDLSNNVDNVIQGLLNNSKNNGGGSSNGNGNSSNGNGANGGGK